MSAPWVWRPRLAEQKIRINDQGLKPIIECCSMVIEGATHVEKLTFSDSGPFTAACLGSSAGVAYIGIL